MENSSIIDYYFKGMALFTLRNIADDVLAIVSILAEGGIHHTRVDMDVPNLEVDGDEEGIRNLLQLTLMLLAKSEGREKLAVRFRMREQDHPILEFGVDVESPEMAREAAQMLAKQPAVKPWLASLSASVDAAGGVVQVTIPIAPAREPPGVLNFCELLEEFEDRDLCEDLVAKYVRSVQDRLQHLKQALEKGDLVTVHREAHSIKGGALNISAPRVRDAALNLEMAAKREELLHLPELLKKLELECAELESFIQTMPLEGKGQ